MLDFAFGVEPCTFQGLLPTLLNVANVGASGCLGGGRHGADTSG